MEKTIGIAAITASGSDRDRWFNPGLVPASDRLRQIVSAVVVALEQHAYRRALKPLERERFHKVLAALTANLVQHYLIGAPGGIPVPRSKKVLAAKPTRYDPFVFPNPFPKWLEALQTLGFLKQRLGVYSGIPGQSKQTTVRAGARLIKLVQDHNVTLDEIRDDGTAETIILSRSKRAWWDDDPDERKADYDDTTETRRLRAELKAINEWLAKADIQFDDAGYRAYVEALERKAVEQELPRRRYPKQVDVTARKLWRRFTMNRFDRGGRLVGGFWVPLPKQGRLWFIRIEGEAVTGLDYSQLNPLLCYSVAGAKPPAGDAYTLPKLEQCREGVKKTFNAMLFKHPLERFPRGVRKLFPPSVKCTEVTAAILQRNPKLKAVLSSGIVGHKLQFLESKTMMHVLDRCRELNITALAVFDCVYVKETAAETVRRIMEEEFKATAGLDITVKQETREPLIDGN